jgi:cyclic beta-1,2-glucan synthetase
MGTGDWNDGMNRVGHEGRGESVWLAWFLCAWCAVRAAGQRAASDERARALDGRAHRLDRARCRRRLGRRWFRRAFFDNGAPLGSSQTTNAAST